MTAMEECMIAAVPVSKPRSAATVTRIDRGSHLFRYLKRWGRGTGPVQMFIWGNSDTMVQVPIQLGDIQRHAEVPQRKYSAAEGGT